MMRKAYENDPVAHLDVTGARIPLFMFSGQPKSNPRLKRLGRRAARQAHRGKTTLEQLRDYAERVQAGYGKISYQIDKIVLKQKQVMN